MRAHAPVALHGSPALCFHVLPHEPERQLPCEQFVEREALPGAGRRAKCLRVVGRCSRVSAVLKSGHRAL